MYVPPANRVNDRGQIVGFMANHGFATVISHDQTGLTANHLPVLWNEDKTEWGTLRSHMARANSQWRHFNAGEEVLCIFHGPHAYISPSWYVMQHTVPTWNYATVHAYGIPKVMDEPALRQVVYDTTEKYESGMPHPWVIPLTEQEIAQMLKAIVGFSIEITRVDAKFKLGQNRSEEDQVKMLRQLTESADLGSVELAKFIHAQKNL